MRIVAQYVPLLLTQRLTLDADEYQRRACEATYEVLDQIASEGFQRSDLDLPDPRSIGVSLVGGCYVNARFCSF